MKDPFAAAGIELELSIRQAGKRHGLELTDQAISALAIQARRVLVDGEPLHLTSIRDPAEFLRRHVEESLAGAARIDPAATGTLLDLGSGNGYPGLPTAAARPGLRAVLAEASVRKSAFLSGLAEEAFPSARVLTAQIQRAGDLEEHAPVRVLTTRAMGNWERLVPRLRESLTDDADLLIWAGSSMEQVSSQKRWKRFDLVGKTALPGLDRAWIWHFRVLSG